MRYHALVQYLWMLGALSTVLECHRRWNQLTLQMVVWTDLKLSWDTIRTLSQWYEMIRKSNGLRKIRQVHSKASLQHTLIRFVKIHWRGELEGKVQPLSRKQQRALMDELRIRRWINLKNRCLKISKIDQFWLKILTKTWKTYKLNCKAHRISASSSGLQTLMFTALLPVVKWAKD